MPKHLLAALTALYAPTTARALYDDYMLDFSDDASQLAIAFGDSSQQIMFIRSIGQDGSVEFYVADGDFWWSYSYTAPSAQEGSS